MEPRFNPTAEQLFELEPDHGFNFIRRKERIDALVAEGRFSEACEARYDAFMLLAEALPDDEPMPLRWEHANSRAAISILYGSAMDHFRIGDLEMCMAQLELLLDIDPEDHFESINLLALCYVAYEEWESFDDLALDLSDKSAEAVVAKLWALHRRDGKMDRDTLAILRRSHVAYYDELRMTEHPADDNFKRDIASERPSQRALAREWWLMTEPLWQEYSDFVEALRAN